MLMFGKVGWIIEFPVSQEPVIVREKIWETANAEQFVNQQLSTTVDVLAKSVVRDYTVNSCLTLSQTTCGLLLVQYLGPQVGGFVDPEIVSPNAGITIVVGTYVKSMVRTGKVGWIIEFPVSQEPVMVNGKETLSKRTDGQFVRKQVKKTLFVVLAKSVVRDYTVNCCVALSQTTCGLLLVQVLGPQVGGFVDPEIVSRMQGLQLGPTLNR